MSLLQQLGIVKGDGKAAAQAFEAIMPNFFEVSYERPSDYIKQFWQRYTKEYGKSNRNQNGTVFEYLLATLLLREGLYPLYLSAQVTFVPNVVYDLLIYAKDKGPIVLSAKTTLRERYKQADLEAFALKNVHKNSLALLITLDEQEAERVSRKILQGEVLGLDKVVVATTPDMDELISELKHLTLIEAPQVETVTGKCVSRALLDRVSRGNLGQNLLHER